MRRFFTLAAGLAVATGSVISLACLAAGPAVAVATSHQASGPSRSHLTALGPLRIVRVSRTGFELVNQAHDLCLIANPSGDGTNGDKVELWTCSSSRPGYQLWTSNTNGKYINQAHQLCLDANASGTGTNGDIVQLWSCGAANKLNQDWHTPSGTIEIVNDAGGLCLDAAASNDGGNGDTVQLWSCGSGKTNQEWREG